MGEDLFTQLSDEYWQALVDNDLEKFAAFLNERFLTWPSNCDVPMDKQGRIERQLNATADVVSFEMGEPLVQWFNDSLANYFHTYSYVSRDRETGDEQTLTGRSATVWVRSPEGVEPPPWTILASMSYPT